MEQVKDFKDYCCDILCDKLDELSGENYTTSFDTLADELFQSDIDSGFVLDEVDDHNWNHLREYSYEASEYFDTYDESGLTPNPFSEPSLYFACMIRYAVDSIIRQTDLYSECGSESKVVLTDNMIQELKADAESVTSIQW